MHMPQNCSILVHRRPPWILASTRESCQWSEKEFNKPVLFLVFVRPASGARRYSRWYVMLLLLLASGRQIKPSYPKINFLNTRKTSTYHHDTIDILDLFFLPNLLRLSASVRGPQQALFCFKPQYGLALA